MFFICISFCFVLKISFAFQQCVVHVLTLHVVHVLVHLVLLLLSHLAAGHHHHLPGGLRGWHVGGRRLHASRGLVSGLRLQLRVACTLLHRGMTRLGLVWRLRHGNRLDCLIVCIWVRDRV